MTEMDSAEFDRLQNRMIACYEVEQYGEGEKLARWALIDHPNDPDVLGWLASFLGAQERVAEANEFIDRALRLRPADDRLLWIKSSLEYLGGDHAQALAASSAALELEPDDVDNLLKQAALLIVDDQITEGRQLLSRALALDPDNAEAHRALAASQLRTHDWEAAEDAFGAALRIDADDGEAWHGLGVTRMMRNKVRASQSAFTAALGCNPKGNAVYYLAWPVTHAYYRSRWIQPLIVLLLVCAPYTGLVSPLLRVTAAALLIGAIADAVLWLFLGGGLGWRALLARTRAQRATAVAGFAALVTVFTMLGIAVDGNSPALARWALIPIAALWIVNLLDCALEPDEDETSLNFAVRMLLSVGHTVGFDLKLLRKRLSVMRRRDSTTSP